jgi:hypothetical protein
MNLLDVVALLCAGLAGVAGWRHGAAVTVFSMCGVLIGAVLGVRIGAATATLLPNPASRVLLGVTAVIALVMIGQAVGGRLGRRLSRRIVGDRGQRMDSACGAVAQSLGALLACWVVALALIGLGADWLAGPLRGSVVLTGVDSTIGNLGPSARALSSELRAGLAEPGSTLAEDDGSADGDLAVAAPDRTLADGPMVGWARGRVFEIHGEAPGCGRQIDGTGFVIGPDRVVTNAHVVAGTSQVWVKVPLPDGRTEPRAAQVVRFNPRVDVAVLAVPALVTEPLRFAPRGALPDADAIVLGYPFGGPLDVAPARIRGQINLNTLDIYRRGQVLRDVYSVRARVRTGDSGGPLLAPDGTVYGLVFGTDPHSPETGYALTVAQIRSDIGTDPGHPIPVPTGPCTPNE